MDRKWTANNADTDLESFIKYSPDVEFKRRFPAWFGKRETFCYAVYSQNETERYHQAILRNEEPSMTKRELRKLYKVGLAQFHIKLEEERRRDKYRGQEGSTGQDNIINECLRCMLVSQGSIFINESSVYPCRVAVQKNIIIDEQEVELQSDSLDDECDYATVMAMSVAISNIEQTPAVCENQSLFSRVVERTIADKPNFTFKNEEHQCETAQVKLIENRSAIIRLAPIKVEITEEPQHQLIYAPPGFGKTTLQMALAKRGMLVLDTDDVPAVDMRYLKEMLKVSSVLTNRLDLITNTDISGIMFRPSSHDVLSARNPKNDLSEEDWLYWFQKHKIPIRDNLVICEVRKSFLTNWFTTDKANEKLKRDVIWEESFKTLAKTNSKSGT